ncbi:MAG TPA: toll/interleukin-1 receptor domain-containing protein [Trichormus sp. M33_DOE_039]|nr:toll/interleukin-1 receptor domain-containing protein [Trichormus sp. M33_DOE_039]
MQLLSKLEKLDVRSNDELHIPLEISGDTWEKLSHPSKIINYYLSNRFKTNNIIFPLAYETEIFISYAWGGDSETYVNSLDQLLQSQGITIVRDKRNLGYKGLIKTFMEKIGRGKCVIAVISDKYLKSPNCMFELVQIAKNGNFYNRIFPIVLPDAKIFDPSERADYVIHWEIKIQELETKIKTLSSSANVPSLRRSIDEYAEIRATIDGLVDIIQDMNTLTPDIHSESDFEDLLQAIAKGVA